MVDITTQYPFVGFMESLIGGRKENQDTFGYIDTPLGLLLLVCDGMGGGPGGKTASTIAVQSITDTIKECSNKALPQDALRYSIERANETIYMEGSQNPELRGMGTTVVALLISETKAYIAHVGDSRLYQLRNRKSVFRTSDHSVVAEQVRLGCLTEEQARNHPRSNQITRAMGIRPTVEVELDEVPYKTSDRFVLCTDGIWGMLPEQELIADLTRRIGLCELTASLTSKIDNLGKNNGGGHDNLTLAVLDTTGQSKIKEHGKTGFTLLYNKISSVKKILIGIGILIILVAIGAIGYLSLSTYNNEKEIVRDSKNAIDNGQDGTTNEQIPQIDTSTDNENDIPPSDLIDDNYDNPAQKDNSTANDCNLQKASKEIKQQKAAQLLNTTNKHIDDVIDYLEKLKTTNITINKNTTDITKTQKEKERLRHIALDKMQELKTLLPAKEREIDKIYQLIKNDITVQTVKTGITDKSKGHIDKIKKYLLSLK